MRRIGRYILNGLTVVSLLAGTACTPASKIATVQPAPRQTAPTAAQKFVQAMDRAPERFTTCSLAEFESQARALGITTPPKPEIWQEMLTASLDASSPTQFCLFHWGEIFGDSYHEAAYRTFKGRAQNIWIRMLCMDWEIKTAREEPWVAESVLRFTQGILEGDPEPYPSPNGDIKGITAEGGWLWLTLPSVWDVPYGLSRVDMLIWVKRALADRAQWYYSERKRWVSPGAQAAASK